jgi:glyoxylase-like metal-dependent hydrolase (beta-lactamase superfamily II)
MIGARKVVLIEAEIHSDDATVLWLPDEGLLFAGDTLEDPLTYVGMPDRLEAHLLDLDRLAALHPRRILPNHGAAEVIAAGGYGPGLIAATKVYVAHLIACRTDEAARALDPQDLLAPWIASGEVIWFDPYARVHAQNLARVLA